MVVVVMTTAMRIITLVIVVMMMLAAMTMWVMAFTMFVMMIMIVLVVMMFLYIAFYLLNPSSRGSHFIKIKEFGIKYLRERHIAIIAVYDFSFRLDSTKDSANMLTFLS